MRRFLIAAAALVFIGIATWAYFQDDHNSAAATDPVQKPFVLGELTKDYKNELFGFSIKMPEEFTARESTVDGIDTVTIEDGKGNGIQILLTPFDEDLKELTVERIRADVPDLKVFEPLPVEIGIAHKGLAFKSDNPEWNGASREVWFVFRGTLYQISTYERLDPLIKAIFGTWQFN